MVARIAMVIVTRSIAAWQQESHIQMVEMNSNISVYDEQPHDSMSLNSRMVARIAAWQEQPFKGKAGVAAGKLRLNM